MDASPIVATASPITRLFNRIFTRHAMNVALLLMLPMLLAPTLNPGRFLMVDPDIWWHLADARILCATHQFIYTDPYSFTVAGQRWVNFEWLSELPFWFSFRAFQLRGIYLIAWLALGANVLFVYWRGYLKSRHGGAALWAAGLALVLMTVNSGPRTIALAYLAMSAEMAILEAAERGNARLLWLLPPLFCVWINLHGSWPVGIVLLVLYIACGSFSVELGAFRQTAFSARERNRLLAVLAASLAALMVNPYGWRLLWKPFDMMLNEGLSVANSAEFQPLRIESMEGRGVVLAIGLMIVANFIRGRKWKVYELAVIVFAWYSAVDHLRFTYLAAVLTTPMLAADIKRSFYTEEDNKTIPAMNALIAAAAVCVMVFMYPSEDTLQKKLASLFPLQTIASIQPSWRTLNWDYVGGMMAFESKPNFFDSRYDIFDHHGVLADYLGIMNDRDALELMDRYRVDHVLLQDPSPLAYLLQHTPGWKVERREITDSFTFVLYSKVGAAEVPVAAARASGQH
jgi:hypothetical protein